MVNNQYEIPAHVAIIMDGNGRWAKKRFLTKSSGHKAGSDALRKLAEEAEALGIKYLTVYAFSTENWKRPKAEIDGLMSLLKSYINQYISDSKKNNMRIKVIGRRDRLLEELQHDITYLEDLTKDKAGLTMVIALDYGFRDEMTRAVKKICLETDPQNIQDISEETISQALDTKDIPDPDLLIRTSGELRLSNYLMWQLSYTELHFTDKLWPDFNKEDLLEAIAQYNERNRRFGGR